MQSSHSLPITLTHGLLPIRATSHSCALDLYTPEDVTISPQEIKTINLGLSMAIPLGHYGKIATRSSMAREGIMVLGGIIDCDYRGPLGVILYHTGVVKEPRMYPKGSRIAQIIIQPYLNTS